jgi:hypothetical protein
MNQTCTKWIIFIPADKEAEPEVASARDSSSSSSSCFSPLSVMTPELQQQFDNEEGWCLHDYYRPLHDSHQDAVVRTFLRTLLALNLEEIGYKFPKFTKRRFLMLQ